MAFAVPWLSALVALVAQAGAGGLEEWRARFEAPARETWVGQLLRA